MKNLAKVVKANLFPVTKDLKNIQAEISNLKKEMNEILKMDNKVMAIIHLFQVISPLQDKGGFSQTIFKLREKNYGQLDQTISALEVLQMHFKNAGRNRFGINRTEPGEEVTAAKVFLGDVFGIWTISAAYCLQNQKKLKETLRRDVSKDPQNPVSTWYLINDYQAGGFVKSHTDGILKQIAVIEKVA